MPRGEGPHEGRSEALVVARTPLRESKGPAVPGGTPGRRRETGHLADQRAAEPDRVRRCEIDPVPVARVESNGFLLVRPAVNSEVKHLSPGHLTSSWRAFEVNVPWHHHRAISLRSDRTPSSRSTSMSVARTPLRPQVFTPADTGFEQRIRASFTRQRVMTTIGAEL